MLSEACAQRVRPSSPSSLGEPGRRGRTHPRCRSVGAEAPKSRVVVKGVRFWMGFGSSSGKTPYKRHAKRHPAHSPGYRGLAAFPAWRPAPPQLGPFHQPAPDVPQMHDHWLWALATGSGRPRGREGRKVAGLSCAGQ